MRSIWSESVALYRNIGNNCLATGWRETRDIQRLNPKGAQILKAELKLAGIGYEELDRRLAAVAISKNALRRPGRITGVICKSMLRNNWNLGDRPELGIMNRINAMIRQLDVANPSALPNFRDATNVVVGSDYSGQHASSKYESFAFILSDPAQCLEWEWSRTRVREKYLPDGRRFSFKNLQDAKRAAALPHFLRAVDSIPGLLVVMLIEKTIDTLFAGSPATDEPDSLAHGLSLWSPHVSERLFRILHFNSLFIAGLTRPMQHVLWITDQDDIAANEAMHKQMVNAFGRTIGHYLEHMLGHVRVATTASDSGKRDVEDFVSVADFAAGAICEVASAFQRADSPVVSKIIMPRPKNISGKADLLLC